MNRQLYRSRSNKVIAGVCGGIAEYFGIDPTIVRLIWVLVTLTYGIGLIVYIIAAIVVPESGFDSFVHQGNPPEYKPFRLDAKTNVIIGGLLILIGLFAVARRYFHWIDFNLFWPVILIIVGAMIVYNAWRK